MKKLNLIDFSSVQTDSLIKIEERYFYKNEIPSELHSLFPYFQPNRILSL